MSILAQIFDTKKTVSEFEDLPSAIVEAIPHVNDDPRITAAVQLLERLRREKNETINKLSMIIESEPTARSPMDVAADAKLLLAGKALESLGGGQSTATDSRHLLLRQKRALEVAIPQAEIRKQEVILQVIREAIEQVRPLAEDFEKASLECFEKLLSSLKRKAKFYELLTHHGLYTSVRPGFMCLMPVEQILLFGGHTFACTEFFVAERRKYWNLDADREKKNEKGA